MPFTRTQIALAEALQRAAARDTAKQVRLIAGPGTGKSTCIEERVWWLISEGVPPEEIAVVSFTRASARDLENRIRQFGIKNKIPELAVVHVSTLHSLALRSLKKAGLLAAYPVDPVVLDDWELENIFDVEFGQAASITSKVRTEEIRRLHEAYWNTGSWRPPNYLPPKPPISAAETKALVAFLPGRSQVYSCVLPGELIRLCVDKANAGIIDLANLLQVTNLIVDEYQDLNPCDLEFVDILMRSGVTTFVAGDDDQSIYSFRFAAPSGIQNFLTTYSAASARVLDKCFRCTPNVLQTGYAVIDSFPDPNRVPKRLESLYESAVPPLKGVVHRWNFASSKTEASAIAESCRDLIAEGVKAENIMILLSSVPTLGKPISEALSKAGVLFDEPRVSPFSDSEPGRLVFAILRAVYSLDDYVSLRTILSLRKGVGISTCNAIANLIITNSLNLRDVLTKPLPRGVFVKRNATAVDAARDVLVFIKTWNKDDTLQDRLSEIAGIIAGSLGAPSAALWDSYAKDLPDEMTLSELRAFISASVDRQREILMEINIRLGIPQPAANGEARVRILTMHGAKGLSAQVVFIPGLEEALLPGKRRAPYAGLIAEAGRFLFVSITRARFSCILSFSTLRITQGAAKPQTPSRFASSLGGVVTKRTSGLTKSEAKEIVAGIADL